MEIDRGERMVDAFVYDILGKSVAGRSAEGR